ncbi:threonine ammonia-lyase [Candidatus Bathyarchaeota archaeon]|nr:threonine ammonia-lyase [Candidatus Bathyarchaeota archaeon]
MQFQDIFADIKEAYSIVREVAHHTPLDRSNTFSRMTEGEIYLKLECVQRTGSFKIRGAYYTISKLKDIIKTRGCITASAGNHAQGVAYAASCARANATIVMPKFSSIAKIQATIGYGADLVLHGKTYDEAARKALEISEERKSVFIHPFDDPKVIAGQGTIGLEMLEDMPDLDVIVVPVGGGGLISGISIAAKNIKPNIKVYGVQASGAASMAHSFKRGKIVELQAVDTIADGIAIKQPSKLTFEIIKNLVDDVVVVDDNEITYAVFMLLERCKQVVEPAGAVGLAAVLSGKIDVKGKKVGIVISGGNINMSLLGRIIERSFFQENRFVKISGILHDRPGMLRDVLTIVAKAEGNVVTIEHDRTSQHITPGKAEVTIILEVIEINCVDELMRMLKENGYTFTKN